MGCLGMLFLTACTKELSDNFNLYAGSPLNDTVWTKNVLSSSSVNNLFDDLLPRSIIDSFNVSMGSTLHYGDTTLHYGDSTSLVFSPGSCIGSGSSGVPADNALVEIMPLKRKGDFIRTFRPTTTSNGSILETGGGFFIRVSKDGKELTLAAGIPFTINFNDVDTPKQSMQVFYGREGVPAPFKGIDTSFSWIRDYDTTALPIWSKFSNNPLVPSYMGYQLNSKNLRWVMAGKYIDSTLPKTKLTAILSPNFTNKNTAVFAVFNNQKTVVSLRGDYPSRSFFANNIPLKSSVRLISISKIGSDYYLGVTDISSVAFVTHYTIVPYKLNLKDLIIYLNNL